VILLAAPGRVEISGCRALGLGGLLQKLLRDHRSSLVSELALIVENPGCGGNDLQWGFYAVD